MGLFQLGRIVLHSGDVSEYKINCDALTDDDLACVAYMLALALPSYGPVMGIPRGGLRLAEKMRQYSVDYPRILLVDDVLTTGKSMRASYDCLSPSSQVIGAVIFARGECPPWITPWMRVGI